MKIVAVEAYPVTISTRPEYSIVSSLGEHRISKYVLVAIRGDDGIEGYGEASVMPVWSGETQTGALACIREVLVPVLAGRDPREITALSDAMDRALLGNPFTKAALEMAIWDMNAKVRGLPVHALIGKQQISEIRLKFSIGAFPPARAAEVAATMVAQGFTAVKVKVGLELKTDIERVSAVRTAVGADIQVAVDANGGWSEETAASALPHLERLHINAIEQPLHRRDMSGSGRIRKKTEIPVMLDEAIFTADDARDAIAAEACELISIYPGKNGGIGKSLEIARLAADAGIDCVIGSNLEWDVGSAAMLHVAAVIPNLSKSVGHDIIGPIYHERRIGTPPIRIANGRAAVPEGAGLGVNLDHATVSCG